ncbi:MAG TPA: hypothetical protein VFI23_06555 [Rhizomicrobium sp.]|nr:hypothetical protein [Rhizomicrobium sp.]
MTNIVAGARPLARAESRFFYFQMALVCMAVAFLGFLPTYWMPVAQGAARFDPVVHIHGMVFFSWTIFFAVQTWIAATGQIARHRMVGLIGVSLATAMVILGILVAMHAMHGRAASGRPDFALRRSIVPLADISCFAILMIAAFFNIPRPEWHKRLMLVAAISILGAPIFRWFVAFGHVPRPTPLHVVMEAQGVVILLCLFPILHDWRLKGRLHPAYIWGFAGVVLSRVLQATAGPTEAWHGIASWVASLA